MRSYDYDYDMCVSYIHLLTLVEEYMVKTNAVTHSLYIPIIDIITCGVIISMIPMISVLKTCV